MTDAINTVRSLVQEHELGPADTKQLLRILLKLEEAIEASADDQYGYSVWVQRFFQHRIDVGSPLARFTAADGKAIKAIKSYLRKLTESSSAAYEAFDYVLINWRSLSPFLQSMITLPQMNKYLDEIVMKLNPNGAAKTKTESDSNNLEAYRRDLAKRLSDGAKGTPQ